MWSDVAAQPSHSHRRRWLVLLALMTTACVFLLRLIPAKLLSDDTAMVVVVIALFALAMCAVMALGRSAVTNSQRLIFHLSLVIWWFLLAAEVIFDRTADASQLYQAQFSMEAWGEAALWVSAMAALCILLIPRPQYLAGFFRGSNKWVSAFALACLLAVTYSPDHSYALGWCFKLLLVVLLVRVCAATISRAEQILTLFQITMWGFLVLSVVPVVEALFNPVTAFNGAGGRLTADPTVISERAATVLLLALILHTVRKRMLLKLVCLISAAIMIAALGKTAIAAGLFAVAVYYALRKRVVAGLVLLGAVGVLAGVIYFAVPQVSRYFALYAGADTLTGRTNIWLNAIGQIKQRPIIGHGYLASRFMWVAERGRIAEVMHLHNGFLDVLYNLGLLGLIPMFLMHAILVRSIWRTMVLTRRPDAQSRLGNNQEMSLLHLLAVGCAALYVNLLINGLLGTTFGGRATAPFMLFLALLAIAEMIYCRAAQYAPVAATKAA